MINYFDASTIAMLALGDRGSEELGLWIADQPPATNLTLSDFGWGELVSAVGIRVRQRLLSHAEGHRQLMEARLVTAGWAQAPMIAADLALATDLVADFDLGLKLPDAIYVAIAERLNALLVTADAQQARAAARRGLPMYNPLSGDADS